MFQNNARSEIETSYFYKLSSNELQILPVPLNMK